MMYCRVRSVSFYYGNINRTSHNRCRRILPVELLCSHQQNQVVELGELLDSAGCLRMAHTSVPRSIAGCSRRSFALRFIYSRPGVQYLDDYPFWRVVGCRRSDIRTVDALSRRCARSVDCTRYMCRTRYHHGPRAAQYLLPGE